VKKHGGQERPVGWERKRAHAGEIVVVKVAGGHDAEKVEEGLDLGGGQAELEGEDQAIDQMMSQVMRGGWRWDVIVGVGSRIPSGSVFTGHSYPHRSSSVQSRGKRRL
jgi:hypothetical protein